MKKDFEYVLYYSNNNDVDRGKCLGSSPKQLMQEFADLGRRYKYAYISKIGSDEMLYAYNAEFGNFVSLSKKRKRGNEDTYVFPISDGTKTNFRTKQRQFTKSWRDRR